MERNVRWQILEWRGMCITKTSTTERVVWVQLNWDKQITTSQTNANHTYSLILGSGCYHNLLGICSQGFKFMLWHLQYPFKLAVLKRLLKKQLKQPKHKKNGKKNLVIDIILIVF